MAQDPLIRLVDPRATRLQLARRDPKTLAQHPIWKEAHARLSDRLTCIRLPDGPRLDYGISEFGQPIDHEPASLDLIVSVGLLAYLSDVRSTLGHFSRLLRQDGLLVFCTLGPDSFHGLAKALGDPSRSRHIPGQPDMHDLGDALIEFGLADPVMDAERLRFSYSSAQAALADIRALGGNSLLGRPAGLSPPSWAARIQSALESMREGGQIIVPVELVFGHAWAGHSKRPQAQEKTVQWVGRHPKNSSSGI